MDPYTVMTQLVAIPSVFPLEGAVSAFIEKAVLQLGCQVERVPCGGDRMNLIVTTQPANRYLGFYGHMDTVPPDVDYRRSPFEVVVEGNIARGLGVCDMKGGLACIIAALAQAKTRGLPVKAAFGVDEENISVGAHALVDSGLMGDIDFLVVAESGQVTDTSKAYSLGYGRKGRIVLEATIKGRKAHAAEAERGVNAILQGLRFSEILSNLNLASHPRLGPSKIVVQKILAEADAFSVPDACVMTFSLLSAPGVTSTAVIEEVLKRSKASGIEAGIRQIPRETPYCEAYEIDTAHPFLKELERSLFVRDGVSPVYNPSVADECIFANRLGIPVLSVGPIGAGDHTAEEWVDIVSLRKTAQVFSEIAEAYTRTLSVDKCAANSGGY